MSVVNDVHEQIIARLVVVLGNVPGIANSARDRADLPATLKPGCIVLDGKEELRTNIRGQSLVGMPPAVYALWPQVWLLLQQRDNMDNETLEGVVAPVGPELSAFRVKIINRVLNDDTLIALVGPNGQIEYHGCDTDMQSGSTMGAEGAMMQLHFCFAYVLDPSDLVGAG